VSGFLKVIGERKRRPPIGFIGLMVANNIIMIRKLKKGERNDFMAMPQLPEESISEIKGLSPLRDQAI
jgi:hypothetical protein